MRFLLSLLWLPLLLQARPIQVHLWISGGLEDLLYASEKAPGWLAVMAHLEKEEGFWLDHGGHPPPAGIPSSLPRPDAAAPHLDVIQASGLKTLQADSYPLTLLNLKALPQFPGTSSALPSEIRLSHPDGPEICIQALLHPQAGRQLLPQALQPWQVTDPLPMLAKHAPGSGKEFPVLMLAEGASAREASRNFPGFPLMIEAPGATPAIQELDQGKRLRVRPARHGRALIHVELTWDSVTRSYATPEAEIVWLRTPALEELEVPKELFPQLRPCPPPTQQLSQRLQGQSDLILLPKKNRPLPRNPGLPHALRLHLAPENRVWVKLECPVTPLRSLRNLPSEEWQWLGEMPGAGLCSVILPADLLAGAAHGGFSAREILSHPDSRIEVLELRSRDWLLPLEDLK